MLIDCEGNGSGGGRGRGDGRGRWGVWCSGGRIGRARGGRDGVSFCGVGGYGGGALGGFDEDGDGDGGGDTLMMGVCEGTTYLTLQPTNNNPPLIHPPHPHNRTPMPQRPTHRLPLSCRTPLIIHPHTPVPTSGREHPVRT